MSITFEFWILEFQIRIFFIDSKMFCSCFKIIAYLKTNSSLKFELIRNRDSNSSLRSCYENKDKLEFALYIEQVSKFMQTHLWMKIENNHVMKNSIRLEVAYNKCTISKNSSYKLTKFEAIQPKFFISLKKRTFLSLVLSFR